MFLETRYTWIVNKGPLADYFEKNYLRWQLEHGRVTQAKFAKMLGFSQSYLNQLFEGRKTSMGYHAALHIADTLQDDGLLDILGYSRPPDLFPASIRSALVSAMLRMQEDRIDPNSPEGLQLFIEALMEVDPNTSIVKKDLSDNSKT